jgi:hypothetical protein
MKIEKFSKDNLRGLRPQIDAALSAIGAQYGITLKLGNARFSEFEATFKLECRIPGKVKDYSQELSFLGLPPLGTGFKAQGREFIVSEHKPNAPKYNVVAIEAGTRKAYKFTAESINRILKPV